MDIIADLAFKLDVMKQNTIDNSKIQQKIKLDAMLDSMDYWAEEKIDGCNYTLFAYRFFSQEKNEKTDNFPHLRDFFKSLNMPNLVIAGEINYPGKTSQYCVSVTGASPETALAFQTKNGYIHYTMYDIMRLPNGVWINNYTLENRRKFLEFFYDNYVKGTPYEPFIHLTRVSIDDKRRFLDDIFEAGGEGTVIKRRQGVYKFGKKSMWEWMKIKQHDSTDLVIMGFKPPKKEYKGKATESWPYWVDDDNSGIQIPVTKAYYNGWVGSVIFGAYDKQGNLKEVCSASGLSEELAADMAMNQNNYLGKVARVDYMELTNAGFPRHPAFTNLHEDKKPTDCTWNFEED